MENKNDTRGEQKERGGKGQKDKSSIGFKDGYRDPDLLDTGGEG